MTSQEIVPHLFRNEFGKLVAVLCKTYGLSNIQLAEDFASETFLKASETWGLNGVPDHPKAWLYKVAKNKAVDFFRRKQVLQQKITPEILSTSEKSTVMEIDLSEDNIQDSQLKMLFVICNPLLAKESQIAMALRILCGFGIHEIAHALLTTKSTINKRLVRAKKTLRDHQISIKMPPKGELSERLSGVLSVLYLLFNEGYFSSISEKKVQKELCYEAMRLTQLLQQQSKTNTLQVNALMALFCFQASRFESRTDANGEPILLEDQDQKLWDLELIFKGVQFLEKAKIKEEVSSYHLEAYIAFWHARIHVDEDEKWNAILQLYNKLLQLNYSPVAALNRTYALSRVHGKEKALEEALKIDLNQMHLYHEMLAEFYSEIDPEKQLKHLQMGLDLAISGADKKQILRKMNVL